MEITENTVGKARCSNWNERMEQGGAKKLVCKRCNKEREIYQGCDDIMGRF